MWYNRNCTLAFTGVCCELYNIYINQPVVIFEVDSHEAQFEDSKGTTSEGALNL